MAFAATLDRACLTCDRVDRGPPIRAMTFETMILVSRGAAGYDAA
jgi:hypothetical protein